MGRPNSGFYQGEWIVKRPEKYLGRKPPIYRSGWEAKFLGFLEESKNVVKWDSEPDNMILRYQTPDGAWHNYHPDFYVEMYDKKGNLNKFLVEIKPADQSPWHTKPKPPKRKTTKAINRYRMMVQTHIKNAAKWKAAKEWCDKRGIKFMVLTEIELGIEIEPKKRKGTKK